MNERLSSMARIVAMLAACGFVLIISLVINAICVSIFGYSDVIGLASKWYTAWGAVAFMAILMLGVDRIMTPAIEEVIEDWSL